MDTVVITVITAAVLIGFILWWFFGKKDDTAVKAEQKDGKQVVEVVVDGGYTPSVVELKSGVPAEIIFNRKDASSCFDEVVLPDFGEQAQLKVGRPHSFKINPNKPGEYTYSCGMRMFFGKVVVK